jgi:hypothetical protein
MNSAPSSRPPLSKLVEAARLLAASAQSALWRAHPAETYAQPFRLIPGMTAAPEPCMLLEHWTEAAHPDSAVAQVKVNGLRSLFVDRTMLSREALPLDCALHCLPGLVELERSYGRKMVFDGEYAEPGGFEATLAAHKRGIGEGTVFLFDAVPYEQWAANRFTEQLHERVRRLNTYVQELGNQFIYGLAAVPVASADIVPELAQSAWANGQEGIVIKNARSLYQRGRSRDWLKVKRKMHARGTIQDVVVENRRAKTLIVRIGDVGQKGAKIVRVSAGLTDEQRIMLARKGTGQVLVGFNDTTARGALTGAYVEQLLED